MFIHTNGYPTSPDAYLYTHTHILTDIHTHTDLILTTCYKVAQGWLLFLAFCLSSVCSGPVRTHTITRTPLETPTCP